MRKISMTVGMFLMMLFIGIIAIIGNFVIPLLNILYFIFSILGIICIGMAISNKKDLSVLKAIGIGILTGALLFGTYICKSRVIEIQSTTGLDGFISRTFGMVIVLFLYYLVCSFIIFGMMWLASSD